MRGIKPGYKWATAGWGGRMTTLIVSICCRRISSRHTQAVEEGLSSTRVDASIVHVGILCVATRCGGVRD